MSNRLGKMAGPALMAAVAGTPACQQPDGDFSIMVTTGAEVREEADGLDNSVPVDVVPVDVQEGDLATVFKEQEGSVVGVDTEVFETANGVRTAVVVSGAANNLFNGEDSLSVVFPLDPGNMLETANGSLITVASTDYATRDGVRCELAQVREVRQDGQTPRAAGEDAPAGVARRFSLGTPLPEVDPIEVADPDVTGLNELFGSEEDESVLNEGARRGIGGFEFLPTGGPFLALQCFRSDSGAAKLRLVRPGGDDDDDSADGADDDDSAYP